MALKAHLQCNFLNRFITSGQFGGGAIQSHPVHKLFGCFTEFSAKHPVQIVFGPARIFGQPIKRMLIA